jgi:hypothetical protein
VVAKATYRTKFGAILCWHEFTVSGAFVACFDLFWLDYSNTSSEVFCGFDGWKHVGAVNISHGIGG